MPSATGYNAAQLKLATGDTGSFVFDALPSITTGGIQYANVDSSSILGDKYMYKIWLEASGSGSVSWHEWSDQTDHTFALNYIDAKVMYWCSTTPSLEFSITGSCEVAEGCLTTVNFNAYVYAYKSDLFTDYASSSDCTGAMGSAWSINRNGEGYGLSSCDLNGDSCVGFTDGTFGQPTYVQRGSAPMSEQLYYDLGTPVAAVGSTYQVCFSSLPVLITSAIPDVTNRSLVCDLGCLPNTDCTENKTPGQNSGSITILDSADVYATVMVIQNVANSEHQVAYAWGHPPDAAASLVPGFAMLVAAVAMM